MVSNMSAIAIASCSLPSVSSADRGPHPGEVGAGTERRPVAGQDDRPELRRVPRGRAAAKAVRSSAMRPASNALWTSGRARVTRATTPAGPVRSTRRLPFDMALTAASYGSDRRSTEVGGADHDPLADPAQAGPCQVVGRVRARRAPTRRRCRSPPPPPAASAPRSARAGNRGRVQPGGPTPSSASRHRPS